MVLIGPGQPVPDGGRLLRRALPQKLGERERARVEPLCAVRVPLQGALFVVALELPRELQRVLQGRRVAKALYVALDRFEAYRCALPHGLEVVFVLSGDRKWLTVTRCLERAAGDLFRGSRLDLQPALFGQGARRRAFEDARAPSLVRRWPRGGWPLVVLGSGLRQLAVRGSVSSPQEGIVLVVHVALFQTRSGLFHEELVIERRVGQVAILRVAKLQAVEGLVLWLRLLGAPDVPRLANLVGHRVALAELLFEGVDVSSAVRAEVGIKETRVLGFDLVTRIRTTVLTHGAPKRRVALQN